jgi:phosphatidate cytidylyltransferase
MAPIAIGVLYLGGWAFLLFWTAAALAVWWEWSGLVADAPSRRIILPVGGVLLAAAAAALAFGRPGMSALLIASGAVAAGIAARQNKAWAGSGVIYAGALLFAPPLLRADPAYGLTAILMLFAVVWTSDIAAYFAGRLIGGPKLWPQVSPKKTWSGAICGTLLSIAAGVLVAKFAGVGRLPAVAAICLLLSIASQAGDLFESGLKRRFEAKDSSQLIPGHGGLMDRLDGFVIAAVVALAIGLVRAGADAPSRGLLIW